jgi:hypothetical protein
VNRRFQLAFNQPIRNMQPTARAARVVLPVLESAEIDAMNFDFRR